MSKLEQRFEQMWRLLGGPPLVPEYRFHATRKWRFDFVSLSSRVPIELEGGIWTVGAHTRGKHFNSDCEKYNAATLDGWKVIRLTTDMIHSSTLEPIISFARRNAIP